MEPLRNAASADNKSSNLLNGTINGNHSNQTSQSAPSAQPPPHDSSGGENAPPLGSTGGRVRKQAVIANVAAEPAKKKAKKLTHKPQAGCIEIKEETSAPSSSSSRRKACGECPGCFLDSRCGTCSSCVSDAKRKPACKSRKCWMIKHGLEGPVEADGATPYCVACGYDPKEDVPGIISDEEGAEVEVNEDDDDDDDGDDDVPVSGDHLLLCDGMTLGDNCPRSYHIKCVLGPESIVSKPGSPPLYKKPKGEWLCPWHVAKEKGLKPPLSKREKEIEKEKKKKKQSTLANMIVKRPKVVVKVKSPPFETELEQLKRDPAWISCLSILYLLKEELKISFQESKALKGAFPIRELEVAFCSLKASDLEEMDYSILNKKLDLDKADEKTLAKFYAARSYDLVNDDSDFALGQGLLNLVMHRLLISRSTRSSIRKDNCNPGSAVGMDLWWPMLRSRVVMWHCIAEANKTFLVERAKEASEIAPAPVPAQAPTKAKKQEKPNVLNSDLNDEAVSSLKRLINLNTNVAGGSNIFKAEMSVLERYLGPKLRPKLARVHSVFKANSSGKAKQTLRNILYEKSLAASEKEEEEEEEVEEEEASEEEEKEEASAMVVDEGGEEAEAEEEEEEDLSEAGAMLRELEMWGDRTGTSVFTRPFVSLLSKNDYDTLKKTISTWHYIETEEEVEQGASAYDWLISELPSTLLGDLLKDGLDFTHLTVSTKLKVFKSLCESTMLLDKGCIDELHLFTVSDIRNFEKPLCYDAFGRAYFFNESLQPAMACRFYRTVGSYDKPGRKKMMEVVGGLAEGDPCEGWEIVAEGEKDLERLLKCKEIFNDVETKVLKEKLEFYREQVVLEKEQVSKIFEREKKKAILAALPRRTSSRRGGAIGDEVGGADEMSPEVLKALGIRL
ncbi:hypothetical protein TrST_g793 [Triparma strigata]|uniref:CXXC-type domain-containing protein n=1 Tax=Triparma strigata TaxID=1606541 RepID=A0A9W7BDE1_9STRA|nr:hypothetical protein TrST_g793 [Triparma strigata]